MFKNTPVCICLYPLPIPLLNHHSLLFYRYYFASFHDCFHSYNTFNHFFFLRPILIYTLQNNYNNYIHNYTTMHVHTTTTTTIIVFCSNQSLSTHYTSTTTTIYTTTQLTYTHNNNNNIFFLRPILIYTLHNNYNNYIHNYTLHNNNNNYTQLHSTRNTETSYIRCKNNARIFFIAAGIRFIPSFSILASEIRLHPVGLRIREQ